MSRKPRVVIMPAVAPRCCSAAFVATVVPWKMWSTSARPTPAALQISVTPRMNARDGSSGVLATLCVRVRLAVVSVNTMSVNVPPTSTPISRIALACVPGK